MCVDERRLNQRKKFFQRQSTQTVGDAISGRGIGIKTEYVRGDPVLSEICQGPKERAKHHLSVLLISPKNNSDLDDHDSSNSDAHTQWRRTQSGTGQGRLKPGRCCYFDGLPDPMWQSWWTTIAYLASSGELKRPAQHARTGVCHVSIVDWQSSRVFIGEERVIGRNEPALTAISCQGRFATNR